MNGQQTGLKTVRREIVIQSGKHTSQRSKEAALKSAGDKAFRLSNHNWWQEAKSKKRRLKRYTGAIPGEAALAMQESRGASSRIQLDGFGQAVPTIMAGGPQLHLHVAARSFIFVGRGITDSSPF
jgi:hypothetical protein